MQTLTVVIASASGLALGYATAAHFASEARKSLQAKLKDESSALKEAQTKLKALKSGDTAKPGKGKAKKTDKDSKKIEKIEKQAADATKEIERLKNAQMAADKAHADALAKVETQLEEAKGQAEEAAKQAEEAAKQAEEAAKQAEQAPEKDETASTPSVNAALLSALEAAGSSLDDILAALVEHEGQTGALLGDINGIVIAKAGDSETVENTAAASNTIISLPQKLEGMLPLDTNFGYRLQDGKSAIAGHAFETQGELMAITTVGAHAPTEASLDAVVKSLSAALK